MSKKSEEMSLSEACALTRNFGKYLKGMARLQEAANTLEASDSVLAEQRKLVTQAQAALGEINEQIATAEAQLADLQGDINRAIEEARQIVADAKQQAAQMVAGAQDRERKAAEQVDELAQEVTILEGRRDKALAEEGAIRARIDEASRAALARFSPQGEA